MWLQMKKSQMNVVANEKVSKERGLECIGLKWTWSQFNGLKWIGINNLGTVFVQFRGRQPTTRGPDLVRSLFTNCGNCMTCLVVLYFMYLPSLQFLVLHTYDELLRNSTILLGFRCNYENQK